MSTKTIFIVINNTKSGQKNIFQKTLANKTMIFILSQKDRIDYGGDDVR